MEKLVDHEATNFRKYEIRFPPFRAFVLNLFLWFRLDRVYIALEPKKSTDYQLFSITDAALGHNLPTLGYFPLSAENEI